MPADTPADSIDFFIPVIEKDFPLLPFVTDQIKQNSIPKIGSIFIVSNDDPRIRSDKVRFVHEEEVLRLDRTRLQYRPNWIYQQFLKLFQKITSDRYVSVDGDLLFLKPIAFDCFYLTVDQFHLPYFQFSERVLQIGKVYPHSFIADFMVFDRHIVREIMERAGFSTPEEFFVRASETIGPECYPSEFELYGNYCCRFVPSQFHTRHLHHKLLGKHGNRWHSWEIRRAIRKFRELDTLSLHSWEKLHTERKTSISLDVHQVIRTLRLLTPF